VVNLSLIAINCFVFLYELSLGARIEPFLDHWGVVPLRIAATLAGGAGISPVDLLTLVTAMFLHGGWLHIGGNMLFLWIFGDNVEDRLGHGLYLAFYLVCGIVANLAQVYSDPTSTVAAIGASGAIAGVLGAYLVTFPGARVSVLVPILFFFWVFDVPALIVIGVWFVTQLFSGVAALADITAGSGGIAWWAHVAGFLFGALLMVVLPKAPSFPPANRHAGIRERAHEDTGLVGLLVGTVSLVSQVAQFVLLARLLVVFLGARFIMAALPPAAQLVQNTTPFLRPFALVVPPLRLAGHVLELYTLAAMLFVNLVGMALTSLIAGAAYGREGRYGRRLA
jgi:membrane associated rhomboid family serine protease